MIELELVGGHFGTGRGRYAAGEFVLPRKVLVPVEHVVAVEESATFIERNILGSLRGMIGGGLGLAPVAMMAGLFVAPLAVVGAIGVTAAAIGAGLGALGAGDKRVLAQITLDDGRGFVCVCDEGVAARIAAEARTARELVERERARAAAAIPAKWRSGPVLLPDRAARIALPAPAPVVTASEPPPVAGAEAGPVSPGLLETAEAALTATRALATDAAATATTAAGDAYAAVAGTADSAWKVAANLFSRTPGKA
ncbi:hypothetical protein [Methylobacterium oryzihabitans]|uniref:Uncharacterized protein n=1 Tax=Methylobacterium oryzihabitans TaxID=2499852 RepID=A0A437P5Q0_9HYPH|nr:hypothetical protein [Methylobacterium oryzihabitans]RVU17468.1 hypothetical protein EOE48_13860 [Methylobacterium oryzihabitans]